jgi:hypothetical protein
MQQTVMVFASSAARTSALSGVLAEGMVSYLQDTNTLEVYDGSAWVGATGDITGLTAGTGISISSATGPVPTVTNSMATEITAKGDLIVGTGSATFDNLAAGSNGETLVADSSTSTGLRYQAPVQANPVINSAMQIAQRGTSISVGAGAPYTLDRWQGFRSGAAAGETVSRQVTGDTTNLPFIQYCARVQRDSGNTSTADLTLSQSFETINSIPFAGKTVTLSFYARRGANYSATSNLINTAIYVGTGTDQSWISGYTGFAVAVSAANTLTTSWQRFTMTGAIGATVTELAINFAATPTGTAGAADFFEVTGVQLEVGSVATPFHTLGGTIQGELAACERYYQRFSNTGSGDFTGLGVAYTSTAAILTIKYKTTMRLGTAALDYSSVRVYDAVNAAIAVTTLTLSTTTADYMCLTASVASGLTQYRSYFLLGNTLPSYYGISMEL